jgi:hypothetical protein
LALSQRERAVIIEDETMTRIVGVFDPVQKWWIPAAGTKVAPELHRIGKYPGQEANEITGRQALDRFSWPQNKREPRR